LSDLVVTCPARFWESWIAEGDAAGDRYTGEEWAWQGSGKLPPIDPGDRLYVVARGRLRGWAPVTRLAILGIKPREVPWGHDVQRWEICRRGDAVACTIGVAIRGFQSWRYRWWKREDELDFPHWRTA
jgi:hypothetical protein